VVIASGKQKIDSDPDGIVALLRAINRGFEFLKKSREKVAESVINKNTFGDPAMVRRVIISSPTFTRPRSPEKISTRSSAQRESKPKQNKSAARKNSSPNNS
jgi:hypothetical protein